MNRRAIALLAALALAGAVIAGCGGGDSGGSTGASNARETSSTRAQGFEALQACLEQHGVKAPNRGSGGGPPSGAPSSSGAPSAKARKVHITGCGSVPSPTSPLRSVLPVG